MKFLKRHRRFILKSTMTLVAYLVVSFTFSLLIYKKIDFHRIFDYSFWVFFGVYFGVSVLISAIKYFVNK